MRLGHTALSRAQPHRPFGLVGALLARALLARALLARALLAGAMLVSLGSAGDLDLWSGGASHNPFHHIAMKLAGNLNPRNRR